MIAVKPSDLHWQTGPLPEPRAHLVLVAWIQGALTTHWRKVYASPAGEWVTDDHVPVTALGAVHFFAVVRDEPPSGLVRQLAERDDTALEAILKRVNVDGGCLVAGADCSPGEIAAARRRGDVYYDRNADAYVRRLPEWLQAHSRFARAGVASVDCCETGTREA